jgi:hypothetical protein
VTTSSNEPPSSDQQPASARREGGTATCPAWCTFDHEGPFYAEPGEHERYLTSTHLRNFVGLHTPDDGQSIEVSVWLLGNGAAAIPLEAASAVQLRAWAAMLLEAAAELDALASDILLPDA